jgi:hypothetical protein
MNTNDKEIRHYDTMDVYPDAKECPENCYNLWRKFRVEELFEGDYEPKLQALDVLLLNHIRILCANEEEVYDYFVKWLAHMLKYPAKKYYY